VTIATTLGFRYTALARSASSCDGDRLARIVNGTSTTHTLDPSAGSGQAVGLRLPEVLRSQRVGESAILYMHLPTGVASDDGAMWTYSAADGLGSVRQRLDASGQVVSVGSYRPFGLVLSKVEGSPLEGNGGAPYGFTGE
jgi:hypothetical protein